MPARSSSRKPFESAAAAVGDGEVGVSSAGVSGSASAESRGPGMPLLPQSSPLLGPDATRTLSGGGECDLTTGSFVQYDLPFQLRCSGFSFGVFSCSAESFTDWAFDAFDGENWHQLQYCAHSPFSHHPPSPSTSVTYPPVRFWLPGTADCVSTRFRIRLAENDGAHRCMHIRGLELYGTIMPPWRVD